MEKLNVAIVDDNEKFRTLLGEIVSKDKDLHLVATAADGEDACNMIKEKSPDGAASKSWAVITGGGRTR